MKKKNGFILVSIFAIVIVVYFVINNTNTEAARHTQKTVMKETNKEVSDIETETGISPDKTEILSGEDGTTIETKEYSTSSEEQHEKIKKVISEEYIRRAKEYLKENLDIAIQNSIENFEEPIIQKVTDISDDYNSISEEYNSEGSFYCITFELSKNAKYTNINVYIDDEGTIFGIAQNKK